jgi:hypothetical protein
MRAAFFLFCILAVLSAGAQDVIIAKDGNVIKAKILEIGIQEVRFKYYESPDGPTVVMKKSDIKTIQLENKNGKTGQIIDIKEDPRKISHRMILDKTSSIKFYFFSPLNHHLALGYEWMVKPGLNSDIALGIIGPGKGIGSNFRNRQVEGAFLRFGPKFLLGSASDVEVEGIKYAHPLKGRYFKVEIILNFLSVTNTIDTGYYSTGSAGTLTYTNKYQSIGCNVGYGRQLIFGNVITVGWHLGVGYSLENKKTNLKNQLSYYDQWKDWGIQRFSHSYFGKNFPLTTTLRFTIGYIMRTPAWLSGKAGRISNKPPSRHSMDE